MNAKIAEARKLKEKLEELEKAVLEARAERNADDSGANRNALLNANEELEAAQEELKNLLDGLSEDECNELAGEDNDSPVQTTKEEEAPTCWRDRLPKSPYTWIIIIFAALGILVFSIWTFWSTTGENAKVNDRLDSVTDLLMGFEDGTTHVSGLAERLQGLERAVQSVKSDVGSLKSNAVTKTNVLDLLRLSLYGGETVTPEGVTNEIVGLKSEIEENTVKALQALHKRVTEERTEGNKGLIHFANDLAEKVDNLSTNQTEVQKSLIALANRPIVANRPTVDELKAMGISPEMDLTTAINLYNEVADEGKKIPHDGHGTEMANGLEKFSLNDSSESWLARGRRMTVVLVMKPVAEGTVYKTTLGAIGSLTVREIFVKLHASFDDKDAGDPTIQAKFNEKARQVANAYLVQTGFSERIQFVASKFEVQMVDGKRLRAQPSPPGIPN